MPDYGAMCEKDLNLLRGWQWNPNITNEYADFLTTEGWKELKFLAMRLQRSFPALMQPNYEQRNFYFQYTKYQRAEASFKAFAEGLFGEGVNEDIQVPQPTLNDTLLRVIASTFPNSLEHHIGFFSTSHSIFYFAYLL